MRHPHRATATRGVPMATFVVAVLGPILAAPAVPLAQEAANSQPHAEQQTADPESGAQPSDGQPLTFLDSVTVSATLRPAPVMRTPGTVTVIDDETIQGRMFETFADLVKYEPGVYVENNVTRLGLNGFNIRGIGGNRVMTLVDGVQTSEQFDFGPFNIHQVAFDVDALKSVEIVRNASSALYGSDALGGVVSIFTKDPADYLQDDRFFVGAKTTWDGRANDASANVTLAGGTDRLQASVFFSANRGEIRNQGTVEATDDTRTAPNPQDVLGTQMLAKLVFTATPGNVWRVAAETYDSRVETEWYSDRSVADFGFLSFATVDSDAPGEFGDAGQGLGAGRVSARPRPAARAGQPRHADAQAGRVPATRHAGQRGAHPPGHAERRPRLRDALNPGAVGFDDERAADRSAARDDFAR